MSGIQRFFPSRYVSYPEDKLFRNVTATGGNISFSGGYKIHTFTSGGTFSISSSPVNFSYDILVVAGGGMLGNNGGAGGGAGGMLYSTTGLNNGNYTVSVGVAGTVGGSSGNPSQNGGNSSFDSILCFGGGGGGYGGSGFSAGANGGSGGGGATYSSGGSVRFGGTGVDGQGNKGGDASSTTTTFQSAGGGGAGGVGQNSTGSNQVGGAGGVGLQNSISGSLVTYSPGGNGYYGPNQPTGSTSPGAGSGFVSTSGYNAQSGTVIVRYLNA
jgi:hypothetical protein